MNRIGKSDAQVRYKICLMGASLNTGNKGVSALCASLVKIIKHVRPDAEIILLIGSRDAQPQELHMASGKVLLNVTNYRLSPKASFHEHLLSIVLMACIHRIIPIKPIRKKLIKTNPALRAVYNADLIGEIRGGDSFSDIYGLRRLTIGAITDLIPLLLQKRFVLLPQTYGPYNTTLGKFIARFLVSKSPQILSRDRKGCEIIQRLLGRKKHKKMITFCPDVAFMLDSVQPDQPNIQPPLDKKQHAPLIGLNVNGLMYNGGYSRDNMFRLKFNYKSFVSELAIKLLKETSGHLLIVPHTFGPPGNINSDIEACRDVLNAVSGKYKKRIHMVMQEYSQSEIKGIIKKCDFFIGSRMHACIAALSQGIPTIGVAYSRKFLGVFDSIEAANMVVDARTTDGETAIIKILRCFKKRNEIGIDVNKKITEAQKIIIATFKDMISS